MRLVLHVDRARLFRWHLEFANALQHAGHDVRVNFSDTRDPLPVGVGLILDFEGARDGFSPSRLSERVGQDALAAIPEWNGRGEADIAIALTSIDKSPLLAARTLTPTYDGIPSDNALFQSLLARRAPLVEIADTGASDSWHVGLPAIEEPQKLANSLGMVVSRLMEGMLLTIARVASGERPRGEARSHAQAGARSGLLSGSPTRFAMNRAWAKLQRVGEGALGRERRWRVAWRRRDAHETGFQANLDLEDFTVLADDGARYYADPFAITRDGRTHVFVEEFRAATGLGAISHFTIDENLAASAPETILESATHLSYPVVFEHDGETWMMPESASAGGLDLYRCARFPDDWRPEERLLEGRYHDATLFEHGGRFWIAAATEAFESSSWDALSLYHAPSLRGPWTPHARNPVLVDSRCARPGGSLLRLNGSLVRPAQNCSAGYGQRLTLRKILTLDPDTFEEETIGVMSFEKASELGGPHSLHRIGDMEFIDFCASDHVLARRTSSQALRRGTAGGVPSITL